MERLQIKTKNELGIETILEVIATYHHDENGKDYVVYTDNTFNDEKKLNLYYSLYKLENDNIKLLETTEKEDKKIGLELIQELLKEMY